MKPFPPVRAFLCATILAALPVAAPHAGAQTPVPGRGALDTPEQIAAERAAVTLLADPDVQAIQRTAEAELAQGARGQSAEARPRLHDAIVQWTASLILREAAGDPAGPLLLWVTDDTPHSWHGIEVPGRGASGDNPDNIYRHAFFDGTGRYEITGKLDPAHRPGQVSFEFTRGTASDLGLSREKRSRSDFGNQIGMLTDRELQIAPDGSFRITVNGEGQGPNHITTPAGSVSLGVRESLADWSRQFPSPISIRRLDTEPAQPRDAATFKAAVLAGLPGYLRFWGTFPEIWNAGAPTQVITGPHRRDGGWGYIAAGHYILAPDEALVIRAAPGGASYTGIQISDAWTITPDARKHFVSLNTAQTVVGVDGGQTYVIAPSDPGVANWVDTAGLRQFGLILRWQGFPAGATGEGLLRGFEVVKARDVARLTGLPKRSPAQRRAELAKRAKDFELRLTK